MQFLQPIQIIEENSFEFESLYFIYRKNPYKIFIPQNFAISAGFDVDPDIRESIYIAQQ